MVRGLLYKAGMVLGSFAIAYPRVCQLQASNYYGLPNDYLQYGVGARSMGMGGAYVALSDDASASYWNPAGLAFVYRYQFLSMYAPFFEGTTLAFFCYAHQLEGFGTLAISDILLYTGGLEEVSDEGEIMSRNESAYKNTLLLSYSKALQRGVSMGFSWKFIYEKVMGYTGTGQGLDAGVIVKPFRKLSVGFNIQNIIRPKIILREEPAIYGVNFKGGIAVTIGEREMVLTLDMNKLEGEKAYCSGGVEVCPWAGDISPIWNKLYLRLGINHLPGITFGIGIKARFLSFDYALCAYKLGNLHRFGFTLLGERKKSAFYRTR